MAFLIQFESRMFLHVLDAEISFEPITKEMQLCTTLECVTKLLVEYYGIFLKDRYDEIW